MIVYWQIETGPIACLIWKVTREGLLPKQVYCLRQVKKFSVGDQQTCLLITAQRFGVLNDLPLGSNPTEKDRNRTQRNYDYRETYVPAYERLFGTQPMDKLSNMQETLIKEQNDCDFRQGEAACQRTKASRKLAPGSSASDHMDRLREKVEEQKAAVANKEDVADRVWHQEGDPVILQDPERQPDAFTGFSVATSKGTVRKVATAPAAPAYRGFSEVETRFKMPDGKILTEENLMRKTSRKSQSRGNQPAHQGVENAADRALKPSMPLPATE